MSPSIVLKPDGSPYMVVGAPGGTSIYVKVAQVIANAIDTGLGSEGVQQMPMIINAIAKGTAPGYIETISDRTNVGKDIIDPEVITELEQMGYNIAPSTQCTWVNTVEYLDDGTLLAIADPRADGKGLAY